MLFLSNKNRTVTMKEIRNTQELSDLIHGGSKVQLIDFYAEWCGPCKVLLPVVEEISAQYKEADEVEIVKVNIEVGSDVAQKYGVRSVPTMVWLKEGEEADRKVGLAMKKEIVERTTALL